MEKQSKFLDPKYLEIRVKELKDIQRGDIKYIIRKSDNPSSRSVYIHFYCLGENSTWFRCHTLRISDHLLKDCHDTQFIIKPDELIIKAHKQQFLALLNKSIKNAKKMHVYREINDISCKDKNLLL